MRVEGPVEAVSPMLETGMDPLLVHGDGVTVTARDVGYFVWLPQPLPWRRREKKVILSEVNVSFEPGTCTAMLGPSGSGKTVRDRRAYA